MLIILVMKYPHKMFTSMFLSKELKNATDTNLLELE